jgi:Amidase
MAITPPTNEDLAEIAGRYRLGLDAGDVESFRAIITGALASYDAVERLYEASRPEPPDRPYRWPAAAGNELGAWYVTTELTTASGGPLAGRRVAIKDNIEVAGLPMMNGSATVEGFIPRRDATVVTRLLDAGATITGKAVCEDLCFSGGSHTSRTGPVLNPWNRGRSAGGSSSGSAALVAGSAALVAAGARRRPRGEARPVAGDDRQHRTVRCHRASRHVRACRAFRRAAGRPDDRRPPSRGRRLPARGTGVRERGRRLPRAAGLLSGLAGHRKLLGQIIVRHMCATGEPSNPSPSAGWAKLRPITSSNSLKSTTASGSKE